MINQTPEQEARDRGNYYLNQGNLISLSYRLDADIQLLLIDDDAIVEGLATVQRPENKDVLLYSPSNRLRSQVEARWGSLTPVNPQEAGLLRFELSQITDQ